jgi:hypothetical protein
MGTVTITLSEGIKAELKRFSWVNWSEIVRLETLKRLQQEKEIERFRKIVSKSKLTQEQAEEFANEVKEGMAKRHGLT